LPIPSAYIRQQFIDFFQKKEHQFVRSSSVVPHEDPTLLFTNAGMNQFKSYFIGLQTPESRRAVNSQKCIRVSGKHNDLEEVGVDDYHHTFFEMLGNWSFGDYYKKEAISWAWELLTEVWTLEKDRLWVTIFQDDDESGDFWKENTDIHPNRILKFGHKDNFWEMGDTGPCGPCTEIHYYTGDDPENQSADGVNLLADYREIWNLVFIQFNRDNKGELHELPEKHVDTGAGFERLVAILNGKSSNYETDLFIPILDKIVEISGKSLECNAGIPHRVIADHLRMLAFSLVDGAMPGNEGRGYVLRRVLRRAARFGRMLEMKDPFIYKLVSTLCEVMGNAFPELKEKQKHVEKVIQAEESSFNETLDRGLEVFSKITKILSPGEVIKGDDAFKLYDTYGFPLDLTELLARENNFTVDVVRFNECMLQQKDRARASGKFTNIPEDADWTVMQKESSTEFTGYETLENSANVIKYIQDGKMYKIVLDKTPFYAESGGQIGDVGLLTADDFSFKVEDVQKSGDEFIHIGTIEEGDIQSVQIVNAKINENRRQQIRRNHTATHLLHQALRMIVGDHVQQAGSLVTADSLRFDLTHYEQISKSQIDELEKCVNGVILQNIDVETTLKKFDDAREEGAVGLFGEKYGDIVRVVNIPGFSKELCGGTHVNRTGDIGGIKIISESALASGIRRLVAISGDAIQTLMSKQERVISEIRKELKCSEDEISSRIQSLINDKKNLERETTNLRQSSMTGEIDKLVSGAENLGECRLVVQKVDDPGDLRELGDQFRQAFKTKGAALIGTIQKGKPMVMCAVTDDLISQIQAGTVVKEMGGVMGGGGGGKPHLATAGGTDIHLLQDALEHGKSLIQSLLQK
jgi:alanyl-tRNA synthetase